MIKLGLVFGQNEQPNCEFSQGIVLKEAGTVRISNYGKHLISIETEDDSRTFPSALGNAAVFSHDDDMQTIYANLADDMLFSEGAKIETRTVIGQTANSAWCEKNALIFQAIDTKNNAFINPLPLIIPSQEDTFAPQIQNVILATKKNNSFSIGEIKVLKKGSYNLYASVIDRTEKNGVPLAPYRINVLINGININTIPFEVLQVENGEIHLQNVKHQASILYQKKGLTYLGEINLTTGKVELRITARDISGNETTETYRFYAE